MARQSSGRGPGRGSNVPRARHGDWEPVPGRTGRPVHAQQPSPIDTRPRREEGPYRTGQNRTRPSRPVTWPGRAGNPAPGARGSGAGPSRTRRPLPRRDGMPAPPAWQGERGPSQRRSSFGERSAGAPGARPGAYPRRPDLADGTPGGSRRGLGRPVERRPGPRSSFGARPPRAASDRPPYQEREPKLRVDHNGPVARPGGFAPRTGVPGRGRGGPRPQGRGRGRR